MKTTTHRFSVMAMALLAALAIFAQPAVADPAPVISVDASLLQSYLPPDVTVQEASPAVLLQAVADAVKENPGQIEDIVTAALVLRKELAGDIIRTALLALQEDGEPDPLLIAAVVTAALNALPPNMAGVIVISAMEAAPFAVQQIEFAYMQFLHRIPETDLVLLDPDTTLVVGGATRLGLGLPRSGPPPVTPGANQ